MVRSYPPARPATELIESLEGRRLLSVTLSNGLLNITGTSGIDDIEVERASLNSSRLKVEVNDSERFFNLSSVSRIKMDGLGGNDKLEVDEEFGPITVPTQLFCGTGNDKIEGGSGE